MLPKSLSASGLQVASMCLRRFEAEYVLYGRGMQGYAASIGSVCHDALENYVRKVHVDKTEDGTPDLMKDLVFQAFQAVIGSSDTTDDRYVDAEQMVMDWQARTDLTGRKVLSLEEKHRWPIPMADGSTIPFSYIMDRFDLEEDTGLHVINDYKTNRVSMTVEELRRKIQARMYALIHQINYPETDKVWVEFDLLRHDRVAVQFSRLDNLNTWNWLTAEVNRILASPQPAEATLNPECGYCVLKTRCPKVQANVDVGGVFSMSDQELVDTYEKLVNQRKAADAALDEIETIMTGKMRPGDGDVLPLEGTTKRAVFDSRKQRTVDPDMVKKVRADVYEDYVAPGKLTMGQFDKMLKDERLDANEVKVLRSLVVRRNGRATLKLEDL